MGTLQENGTQQAVTTQPASQNTTVIKRMQEETVNNVMERVAAMQEAGELVLPKQYHAGNALKQAWLYLQTIETSDKKPAIEVCTKESICNCLLQMVIYGQNVGKNQCYFIPCGKELTYWEDYRGKYMRAKRDTEIAEIHPQVVYEKDNFVYTVDEFGDYQLVKHETSIDNIDITKIKAAYAVVVNKDGKKHIEVMTMQQVRKAWGQGGAKGNSGAHVNFTDQMCKKTIISRACKIALDSSTDGEDESDMLRPDEVALQRAQAQLSVKSDLVVDAQDVQFETVAGNNAAQAKQEEQPTAPQPQAKQPEQPKTNTCPL